MQFWDKKWFLWKRTGKQPRGVALKGFSNLTAGITELPSEKCNFWKQATDLSQINHPQFNGLSEQKCSKWHMPL